MDIYGELLLETILSLETLYVILSTVVALPTDISFEKI